MLRGSKFVVGGHKHTHTHRQCVLVSVYANNVKDRWVHSSKNSC